jgi:hypothetical protein
MQLEFEFCFDCCFAGLLACLQACLLYGLLAGFFPRYLPAVVVSRAGDIMYMTSLLSRVETLV